MKTIKIFLFALLVVLGTAVIGFLIWALNLLEASPTALAALESDSKVTVTQGEYVTFLPANSQPTQAFVFYPGGHVDHRAYAVPLRKIAEQGYLVMLLPVRLNLAFFEVNAADMVIPDFPEIENWVVGGHSLGGVAASLYAKENVNLDGAVYWASYPADAALQNADLEVSSIYGTLDNGFDSMQASSSLLPTATVFVVIKGGNHSQFGDYGLQPGDHEATISREERQAIAVEGTVDLFESLNQ
jgi:hypothetical protein